MTKRFFLIAICLIALSITNSYAEEKDTKEFRGVVTLLNIPAKVIQVNSIIENPKPGTSYIGEEGIVAEIDEIPGIMANWTIVKVRYYEYPELKIIKYKILSEEYETTVKYHAISVVVVGDLSSYIKQENN